MATPAKVSLYNLSELKTTLDDHLPIYLSTSTTPSNAPLPRNQRFTPSYFATYTRHALGYSAVAIAAYIFYLDYVLKQEFVDTKTVTIYAVVAYFILNSALTLWIWFGERGVVFSGSRIESSKTGKNAKMNLRIHSHLPHRKYSPIYRLAASWTTSGSASSGAQAAAVEIEAPFTRFFTTDGYFAPAEFEEWLRRELPIAEKGARKGALESSTDGDGNAAANGRLEDEGDTITLGRSTVSESATPTPSKKRGRPRKDA